jgi:molecular chaperone DnaK (HSP70)
MLQKNAALRQLICIRIKIRIMLLLGIDLGTSAIKVSVVDAATQKAVATAQYPAGPNRIRSNGGMISGNVF